MSLSGNSGISYVYVSAGTGGAGDVVGPASATDNAVARFDTTTGKLLKNSGVSIDASNNVTGAASVLVGTKAATAIIEAISTTQGILFPRMTTAQREAIATPPAGLCVYDTSLNQWFYRSDFRWVNVPFTIANPGFFDAGFIELFEATGNGVNKVAFTAANAMASDIVITLPALTGTLIESTGAQLYEATNTAVGTTGAQTINKPSGTVNFAAAATSLVVTNSLCATTSIIFASLRTNDTTAGIKNVVPAAGSFTITLSAATTAETSCGFFIIN